MGTLRIETVNDVDPLEMRRYVDAVKEVAASFWTELCYWNLGSDDDIATEQALLQQAANLLRIPMTIKKLNSARKLLLVIRPLELSEIETHQLFVVDFLSGIKHPARKSEILTSTGIPPSQWPVIIAELKNKGFVTMHGEKSNRTYSLSQGET